MQNDIKIGDDIKYIDDRIGVLIDINIVPNGVNDLRLVAILTMRSGDNKIIATSDKFKSIK